MNIISNACMQVSVWITAPNPPPHAGAPTVFDDPLSDTFPDPDHSLDERRFIIIGSDEAGKILVVAHTDDGELVEFLR
jgi:uncharacterized DUF497 family protein